MAVHKDYKCLLFPFKPNIGKATKTCHSLNDYILYALHWMYLIGFERFSINKPAADAGDAKCVTVVHRSTVILIALLNCLVQSADTLRHGQPYCWLDSSEYSKQRKRNVHAISVISQSLQQINKKQRIKRGIWTTYMRQM